MEIISLTESIIEYLSISSVLLLILGLLSFLSVRSLKIRGKAKLLVCTLIVILPLAYPLKTLFPESVKIPVPLELNYFKQHNEIAAENTISAKASFFSNNGTTAGESIRSNAEFTGDKASGPGIKGRFWETISGLLSNWMLIAAIVWGGVFLFSLARVAATGFKTNKFIRLAAPVTNPEILKLLHQCASDTGLRRVPKLFMVEGISTPMVMGFLTPGIIIPRYLLKPELREGLKFTLLHELKHMQQHHNWWLLVESIIGAAYFFHPVFHWVKEKIHEEFENICDSHVIHVTKNSVSYADFLLNQIWEQGSGRNNALALPFVSTASKTATRIHSILENAGTAPFMHMREGISVLFILLVFPSILLLSVAPSVQHQDQALNLLNPPKITSQENADHKSELAGKEKEIPVFEKSPFSPVDGAVSHVEKTAPAAKTTVNTAHPIKLTREETTFVPVKETESPQIKMTDEESKAEVIQKHTALDIVQDPGILGAVSGNNMLLAQKATDTGKATDRPVPPETAADKYLGPPVNELTISRIDNIKILDTYTVLFIMRGGDLYLTRLSEPCPSLLYVNDFNLVSINGRFSKFDRIQAVSGGRVIGTSGMLGPIYPYKYEGNKYKAINLLKKSLLTKLVNEGAV